MTYDMSIHFDGTDRAIIFPTTRCGDYDAAASVVEDAASVGRCFHDGRVRKIASIALVEDGEIVNLHDGEKWIDGWSETSGPDMGPHFANFD